VWLYTHWGATYLPVTVQDALKRRLRWNDESYLARIIFCEMVKGDIDGELGFGIDTDQHGDVWCVVHIDAEGQKVSIEENNRFVGEWSFSEYVKTDLSKIWVKGGE